MSKLPLKIIFMGTPEFAVPSLQVLYYSDLIEILSVITQPDRPAGRGGQIKISPIKELANKLSIPVFQPDQIKKDNDIINYLKNCKADAFVTVAFGQILSKEILDIPKLGTINLHASLLPKYRGPNPIQRAVINGDLETGITTMLTNEGVDTGDILLMQQIPILIDYTSVGLSKLISNLGARLLADTVIGLFEGAITPKVQDNSLSCKAPKLKKEDGLINWGNTTFNIYNLIRGSKPWPGAYTYYKDSLIKIHSSFIPCIKDEIIKHEPGTIINITDNAIQVSTLDSYIDIINIQPSNKPIMNATEWARGARISKGDKFISNSLVNIN